MYGKMKDHLSKTLAEIKEAGLYKEERLIESAQQAAISVKGKEVLNFQISWSIYGLAAALLCFVFIGILILPILGVAWLVFVILGSIKASEGKLYRYPLTIRLIS